EIRDFFWDGIPYRGASWLREEPLDSVWVRVIFVPACGGLIVSVLNAARNAVSEASYSAKAALGSVLKALAACVTLGTGNSLGPEGFNAAVAGCFFAVESVLWPSSPADSSVSLTNTTSMVILSAVIASVISEIGLGSEPAFKVPEYDFRSPGDNLNKDVGIPKPVFPIVGGLTVGVIALAYPE
ncbi:hypothetical protein Gotur_013008, partial [Gossypium turneri]